jgi:segregation and condensation protein B
MGLKAKIEAIIYAAEEPVTLEQIAALVGSAIPAEEVTAEDASPEAAPPARDETRIKLRVRALVEELIADYARDEHGIEIRQVAGGFRMATKAEHHEVVRAFARSLKPPLRLSIPALETLAVIAYKQPVTIPEISEIRGVEAAGVIGTLLDRKLITTAGRKQVIGRPILYKTSKEFLLRFGLNDLSELPSMEEFEKLALDGQVELFAATPAEEAATPAGNAVDAVAPAQAGEPPAGEAEQPANPASDAAGEPAPQAETSAAGDVTDES